MGVPLVPLWVETTPRSNSAGHIFIIKVQVWTESNAYERMQMQCIFRYNSVKYSKRGPCLVSWCLRVICGEIWAYAERGLMILFYLIAIMMFDDNDKITSPAASFYKTGVVGS